MKNILRNAAAMSRESVCVASIIWSVLVLVQTNAVLVTPYAILITNETENLWATIIAFTAISLTVRSLLNYRKRWFDTFGIGVLTTFWMYICFSLWSHSHIYPAAAACCPVVMLQAMHAFITDGKTMHA